MFAGSHRLGINQLWLSHPFILAAEKGAGAQQRGLIPWESLLECDSSKHICEWSSSVVFGAGRVEHVTEN